MYSELFTLVDGHKDNDSESEMDFEAFTGKLSIQKVLKKEKLSSMKKCNEERLTRTIPLHLHYLTPSDEEN
jgi:hypothetical protein